MLEPLHKKLPNAACCSMHQRDFAWTDRTVLSEQKLRSDPLKQKPFSDRKAFGDGNRLHRRQRNLARVGTEVVDPSNPISYLQTFDAGSEFTYFPKAFESRSVGHWHVDKPTTLVDVDIVDACRLDIDDHQAGLGMRNIDGDGFEHLRSSVFGYE